MATDVARLVLRSGPALHRRRRPAGPRQPRGRGERAARSSTPRSAAWSCSTSSARPAPRTTATRSRSATGSDFTIGAGTMYVGGLRVDARRPHPRTATSPTGSTTPATRTGSRRRGSWADEHVVLAHPGTGRHRGRGPGAARGRARRPGRRRAHPPAPARRAHAHQRRGLRRALAEDEQPGRSQGLIFDPATMQLRSESRLLVSWEGAAEPPDPCEPASTGGYLGAENQLIRVQVTAVNTARAPSTCVWGWDNASFLYRVTADDSTNPVLTLDRSPVDDYHRPRAGQAVQVLRAAAELTQHRRRGRGIRRRRSHGQVARAHRRRTTRTPRPSSSRPPCPPPTPTRSRPRSCTCGCGRSS